MLIGHQKIWHFLTQSAKNNRLAHAYLFVGPPAIGKRTLALEFAKYLLCVNRAEKKEKAAGKICCTACENIDKNQHPDVFILEPKQEEKKGQVKTFEIKIKEMRELMRQFSLSSYCAGYKIAIIKEADWLTGEASNAFLKTLEEPSPCSLIILTTSAQQAVLPTIASRCQIIKFLPVPSKELEAGLEKAFSRRSELRKIVRLATGRPGLAMELLNNPVLMANRRQNLKDFEKLSKADLSQRFVLAQKLSQDSIKAATVLEEWSVYLRDLILVKSGLDNLMLEEEADLKTKLNQRQLMDLIYRIQATKNILSNASFNSKLALENLLVNF